MCLDQYYMVWKPATHKHLWTSQEKKQKKIKICSDCMQAPILAHGLITTSKNVSNFSACSHFRKMSGIQVLISAVTCCMGVATLGNGHHAQAMHAHLGARPWPARGAMPLLVHRLYLTSALYIIILYGKRTRN